MYTISNKLYIKQYNISQQQLWDYYFLVMRTIDFWKMSPWKKIDADGMDQECKRFTKDLRQLDKEMRVW